MRRSSCSAGVDRLGITRPFAMVHSSQNGMTVARGAAAEHRSVPPRCDATSRFLLRRSLAFLGALLGALHQAAGSLLDVCREAREQALALARFLGRGCRLGCRFCRRLCAGSLSPCCRHSLIIERLLPERKQTTELCVTNGSCASPSSRSSCLPAALPARPRKRSSPTSPPSATLIPR